MKPARVKFYLTEGYRYIKRLKQFKRKYWSREYDSEQDALKDEHLAHARIAKICKAGIIEIGVLYGDTSKIMAEANAQIPVFGIDPLIPDSMNDKLVGNLELIEANTKNVPNFKLIKDFSFNVVKNWEHKIDYVFIDGDHNYEAVKKDYEDWLPKLDAGGFISFHDSTMNRSNFKYWQGPSKLCDDLIQSDNRVEFVESVGRLTIFMKKE